MTGDLTGALDLGWPPAPIVEYPTLPALSGGLFPGPGSDAVWDSSRWAGLYVRLFPACTVAAGGLSATLSWYHPTRPVPTNLALVGNTPFPVAVDRLGMRRDPALSTVVFDMACLVRAKGPLCRLETQAFGAAAPASILVWPLAVFPDVPDLQGVPTDHNGSVNAGSSPQYSLLLCQVGQSSPAAATSIDSYFAWSGAAEFESWTNSAGGAAGTQVQCQVSSIDPGTGAATTFAQWQMRADLKDEVRRTLVLPPSLYRVRLTNGAGVAVSTGATVTALT